MMARFANKPNASSAFKEELKNPVSLQLCASGAGRRTMTPTTADPSSSVYFAYPGSTTRTTVDSPIVVAKPNKSAKSTWTIQSTIIPVWLTSPNITSCKGPSKGVMSCLVMDYSSSHDPKVTYLDSHGVTAKVLAV
jgi:hypothetical protein